MCGTQCGQYNEVVVTRDELPDVDSVIAAMKQALYLSVIGTAERTAGHDVRLQHTVYQTNTFLDDKDDERLSSDKLPPYLWTLNPDRWASVTDPTKKAIKITAELGSKPSDIEPGEVSISSRQN